jgi:hypothetical protein
LDDTGNHQNSSLEGLNNLLEQTRAIMNGINHLVIQQTPILLSSSGINPIRLGSISEHPIWNPSIIKFDGKYICVTRSSNFYALNDSIWAYADKGGHKTENYVYYLDDCLVIKGVAELKYDASSSETMRGSYGIEDIRLFTAAGKLYGIGASVSRGVNGSPFRVEQAVFEVDGSRIVNLKIMESPLGLEIEKNWAPLVVNDKIYIIYSHEPLVVYQLTKEGDLRLISKETPVAQAYSLRGGTPLQPWRGGYLCAVHQAPFTSDRCYYTHKFLRYDASLSRVETSGSFFIQKRGIEFAAGLVVEEDRLILSYGVSDQAAYIACIPNSELQELLLV